MMLIKDFQCCIFNSYTLFNYTRELRRTWEVSYPPPPPLLVLSRLPSILGSLSLEFYSKVQYDWLVFKDKQRDTLKPASGVLM